MLQVYSTLTVNYSLVIVEVILKDLQLDDISHIEMQMVIFHAIPVVLQVTMIFVC